MEELVRQKVFISFHQMGTTMISVVLHPVGQGLDEGLLSMLGIG